MGKVLDYYRGRTKQTINRTLATYGCLPGFLLSDIANIHCNNERQALILWKGISSLGIASAAFKEQAVNAIAEHQGLILAYEAWVEEFKRDYDNHNPYKSI